MSMNETTSSRRLHRLLGTGALCVGLLITSSAWSQCIPNGIVSMAAVTLMRNNTITSPTTASFLAGCAGAPGAGMQNGPGIVSCTVMISPPRVTLNFTAPSQNAFTQNCSWTCGAQTCRVQGFDGLPVELIEFGIGDAGDADESESNDSESSGSD